MKSHPLPCLKGSGKGSSHEESEIGMKMGMRHALLFVLLCRRERKHPRERIHKPRILFAVLNAVFRKRKICV
jgi:hypothetical protein